MHGWHQLAKVTIAHHAIGYYTSAGDTVFDADYDAAGLAAKEAIHHHRVGLAIGRLRSIEDGQRIAWNRRNRHTGKAAYPRHADTLIGRSGNSQTAALAIITAGLASPSVDALTSPEGFDAAFGQAASMAVLDSSVIRRLRECRQALKRGGIVVVYAPRFRRHGELADVPGLAIAALRQHGFTIVDRCSVLLDQPRQPAHRTASDTGLLMPDHARRFEAIHDDLIVAGVNR